MEGGGGGECAREGQKVKEGMFGTEVPGEKLLTFHRKDEIDDPVAGSPQGSSLSRRPSSEGSGGGSGGRGGGGGGVGD